MNKSANLHKLSIGEQIDRARTKEGRTQGWIVRKMVEAGCEMDEYRFSRKKRGFIEFSKEELEVLSNILGEPIKP